MNIFVLNSGRCGSLSFIRACAHISNYSAGHESRIALLGEARLAWPPRHIEADNRLSWLLGRLDETWGDRARYVHLTREADAVIASFARRADFGIMRAYREGILLQAEAQADAADIARDYLATVEANIRHFLRDKSQVMPFRLEHAKADFAHFWDWIGAEGSLPHALQEWDTHHNASAAP